jgi:4-hydroxy-2-oxoheptanedioate aldolase
VAAVEDAISRLAALGKPAGILTPDTTFAARCIELGATFTAVGIDAGLLARATEALAAKFRQQ